MDNQERRLPTTNSFEIETESLNGMYVKWWLLYLQSISEKSVLDSHRRLTFYIKLFALFLDLRSSFKNVIKYFYDSRGKQINS